MPDPTVVHNTFVLERSYPKTPERVFAAFADPAKKRRWFAEGHSHNAESYTMDFRIGGTEDARYRMGETTPFPGVELASHGTFLDIVPNRRIVEAADMVLGSRRISAALLTIELLPSGTGTDLILTHQAAFFEGADGPERREDGWRKLLDQFEAELTRD